MKTVKILAVVIILFMSGLISYVMFSKMIKETEVSESELETQELYSETEDDNVAKVKLSFEYNNRAYLNKDGSINVILNPGLYEIPGGDFIISYDNEIIKINSIVTLQENLTLQENKLGETDGLLEFSVISLPDDMIDSKLPVVQINYTALKEGSTDLVFETELEGEMNTVLSLLTENADDAPLETESFTVTVTEEPEYDEELENVVLE